MEWFWPEGFYTIVMVGVFALASFAFKQPIAVALAIAAIAGALVSGNGVPVDQLIEGSFGYLDTILIIFSAMIFMKTVQHIGLMESAAAWMIRRFRTLPFRLTMGITGLVDAARHDHRLLFRSRADLGCDRHPGTAQTGCATGQGRCCDCHGSDLRYDGAADQYPGHDHRRWYRYALRGFWYSAADLHRAAGDLHRYAADLSLAEKICECRAMSRMMHWMKN